MPFDNLKYYVSENIMEIQACSIFHNSFKSIQNFTLINRILFFIVV